MQQSENIGDLALALSKAQGMLEGANKTSDNPFFKSKYADLHECIEAAKGALSTNDLAVVQTTDNDESGAIWVYTTLIHKSGQWIKGRIKMKPKKDDDQATGSSITYGRRYGFAAIVGIAQKDDDGNASVNVEGKKEQPAKTQDKPKEDDRKTVEAWLKWIDSYTDPRATPEMFAAQWEQKAVPAMNTMSKEHWNELIIAKKEMETFLKERAAK